MWIFNFLKKTTKEEPVKNRGVPKYEGKIVNYSQAGASLTKNAFKTKMDVLNTADEDIGQNKDTLMARSSELYMSNPIGIAAIRKIRTNVVGRGLRLKSAIDNTFLQLPQEKIDEIQKQIHFLWNIWVEECDLARTSNFYELQSLAIINQLVYGETFALMPLKKRDGELFDLKIQLVESTRCTDPMGGNEKVKNGVELDETGAVVAYYFTKSNDSMETVRIEAYGKLSGRKNVLVMMEKERIGQRRGVPLLAPVMEALYQIGKFTEAELTNATVSALFSVLILDDSEESIPGVDENPILNTETGSDNDEDVNIKMGSGNVLYLPKGKKVEFADPKRPNSSFDNFIIAMTKQVGSALEIPFEVLMNSFNSSYSASRAALLEVWKMYHMRRAWMITSFCKPIYEEFLDEIVAKGYIELPNYYENPLIRKSYQNAEWYGPAQGQLNPVQEVNAAVNKIRAGISTIERETRELNGGDFETNNAQRQIENMKRGELKNEQNI